MLLLPVAFLYKDMEADAIHVYHLLSVLFIYTGWLLPRKVLWIYLVYVGATLLSWRLNTNLCPMTEAEYRRRGWDPSTTPSFTQKFLVGEFPMPAVYESKVADLWVQGIYILFMVAFLRLLILSI
jgi:Protein of Unknown function (DUF2784)